MTSIQYLFEMFIVIAVLWDIDLYHYMVLQQCLRRRLTIRVFVLKRGDHELFHTMLILVISFCGYIGCKILLVVITDQEIRNICQTLILAIETVKGPSRVCILTRLVEMGLHRVSGSLLYVQFGDQTLYVLPICKRQLQAYTIH